MPIDSESRAKGSPIARQRIDPRRDSPSSASTKGDSTRKEMGELNATTHKSAMRDRVQELQLSETIRLEKLTLEARGPAKRAGLPVSDWLAGLPEGERGKWAG